MPSSPKTRGLHKLRFDVYEADPHAEELRKHGYRVPLENRPFRALLILLQRAPELVTREPNGWFWSTSQPDSERNCRPRRSIRFGQPTRNIFILVRRPMKSSESTSPTGAKRK